MRIFSLPSLLFLVACPQVETPIPTESADSSLPTESSSECPPDQGWFEGECLSHRPVDCEDQAPDNAASVVVQVEIAWIEGEGWEDPPPCDWECIEGFGMLGESCADIRVVSCDATAIPEHATPIEADVSVAWIEGEGWADPAPCEWFCAEGESHEGGDGCFANVSIEACALLPPLSVTVLPGEPVRFVGSVRTDGVVVESEVPGLLSRWCHRATGVGDFACDDLATWSETVGEHELVEITRSFDVAVNWEYVFAFSGDGGVDWVLCDADGQLEGEPTSPGQLTVIDTTAPPSILHIEPEHDGVDVAVSAPIVITFDKAMDPSTLLAATDTGDCSDTVQLSFDDFETCVGFADAEPRMSEGGAVATFEPQPLLSGGLSYVLRVTTDAESSFGVPLGAVEEITFTTAEPSPDCAGSVVISQVYGAGGNVGAAYDHDYVELFNLGAEPVTLNGWSLQYTSAAGTTWRNNVTSLSGTIPPHGYFLVALRGGTNGEALPTPHLVGTSTNLAASSGKVALVMGNEGLPAEKCPTERVVDILGYGSTDDCDATRGTSELSVSLAAHRRIAGCYRTGIDAVDFRASAPHPKTSDADPVVCSCSQDIVLNHSSDPDEADECWTIPLADGTSVPAHTSTGTLEGQIFELGETDLGSESSRILAQVGYGSAGSDPRTNEGWAYVPATWFGQTGELSEVARYQASLPTPAVFPTTDLSYAYRFSLDGGSGWTWCTPAGNGATSELPFDYRTLDTFTVTP